MDQLLTVRNLRVWFDVRIGFIAGLLGREQKHVRAIDDISFDVKRGEVFCLVGESGCGKTTTGKALIRLNEPTSGNIFFDVPEPVWDRYTIAEARLRELEPTLPHNDHEDSTALASWRRIEELSKQLAAAQGPESAGTSRARQTADERARALLDEREHDLLAGTDRAVTRLLSKDGERIELMETWGEWFTPARARQLEKLKKELKEAKYQVVRATSQHMSTRKRQRRVRKMERKIQRMESHKEAENPDTRKRIEQARVALAAKTARLTESELARIRRARDKLMPAAGAPAVAQASGTGLEVSRIEAQIAAIRKDGGPALEALEIRRWMDAMADQYDLASWESKGRAGTRKLRQLRRRMQIIYQDPYESLNPKLSIYDIVAEPLLANHVTSSQSEAQAAVAKSLEDVGLRPAQEYMFRYPHELSGGQRQRVGIATALVVDPDFIVADEPVSMLDASVRTEIIALLLDLRKRRNLTYLFITHDLGLAWIIADRIAVMYLGKVVETGNAPEIIQNPRHPYTQALISVVPSPNPSIHREKTILRGERPDPVDIPPGCRFHPRCPHAVGICGWDAEEVVSELGKLLEQDKKEFPEASSVTEVKSTGPLSLRIATKEPARVEVYLRKRIQGVALKRPALGAIRKTKATSTGLDLTLHKAVEPPLRAIVGDISVACHLVPPEAAPAGNVPVLAAS